jgi:hypothetical protein
MREASAVVLDSFTLRSDAKVVRYPERYLDHRGRKMWDTVWALLATLDGADTPCSDAGSWWEKADCTDAGGPPAPVQPPPSLISSSLIIP